MMKLTSTILLAFSANASGVHDLTHLLPPMQARRRVPHKRVKPAQTTELPYDSSIENGRGWNHHTEEFVAHAFEPYTGGLYRLEHSLDVEFSRKVITEMSQYNKVMRSTSYVSGSGWGMKAKASFALDRSVSMQSKDALFVLLARKELGFEGWSFSKLPAFREQAKKALCDKGVFTPEKFEEAYGTYYVQGVRKAAALDIVVKMGTTTSSSDQKVSASLSMSWSGVGKKVSGGSTFSQQVSQEKQSSKVTVHATAFGVDREYIPDANINNLDEVIENFKEVSKDGSGIALKLTRYDDHDDYLRIQNECGRTFESLERNEEWMDKYVDVAVEAKLFAEELLTKPFTTCGTQLALQGLKIFDDLITTPEDELTPEGYMEGLTRLDGIKKAWSYDFDECYVKCSLDYSDRRLSGTACPANRPYCEGYKRNLKWGHCRPTTDRTERPTPRPTPQPTPRPTNRPTVPRTTLSLARGCEGIFLSNGGECFQTRGWEYYDYNECTVNVHRDTTLYVKKFDVEAHSSCAYDYIQVNGRRYCGANGPSGVRVRAGSSMKWYTDSSVVRRGFKMCSGKTPLGGSNDSGATNLEACIGECDSDSQCANGLKCFQRTGYTPVPGCIGRGARDWDYCYDPSGSVSLSGGNDGNARNLQACRGECDADWQCRSGLKCFQRDGGETIPGCKGSGGGNDWDYCYDPKWTAAA